MCQASSDLAKLEQVCIGLKRKVVNVAMDGDCMFASLALQLNYNGTVSDAAARVRNELIAHLRNNQDMVN